MTKPREPVDRGGITGTKREKLGEKQNSVRENLEKERICRKEDRPRAEKENSNF